MKENGDPTPEDLVQLVDPNDVDIAFVKKVACSILNTYYRRSDSSSLAEVIIYFDENNHMLFSNCNMYRAIGHCEVRKEWRDNKIERIEDNYNLSDEKKEEQIASLRQLACRCTVPDMKPFMNTLLLKKGKELYLAQRKADNEKEKVHIVLKLLD